MQILVEFGGTYMYIVLTYRVYYNNVYNAEKKKLRGRSVRVRASGGYADLYKRR